MPELTAQRSTPRFKTAASKAAFHAAYDAVLAQWPVAVEPVDVPSAYGTTHVQVCGPSDGEPLVLLHGGGATSTVWFANVEALTRTHRVYAVDQIGDAGRSVHDGQPIDGPAELMSWLDTLLDTLGLNAAALGGHSYGAWLALSYAIHAPTRVSKLLLLEPSHCFTGMNLSFRLRAVPLFARPDAQRVRNFITWEAAGADVDPAWLTLAALAGEVGTSKLIMPHQPTKAELRAATMPTLVLTAQNSKQHDIRRLAANAQRLMPNAVAAVLPDASHYTTIPTHNPQQLNRELTQFLA